MMKSTLFLKTLLLVLFISYTSQAQDIVEAPKPRVSPVAIAKTLLGDVYIKVVYGQPQKKNRVVFGELVPFGQVWRTGANEATEIHFTSSVLFSGKKVDAGLYTLFTIPGKDTWTIILNKGLGQSGAFQYDEKLDLVRVEVPAKKSEKVYEAFMVSFLKGDNTVNMLMNWDDVVVSIPIEKVD